MVCWTIVYDTVNDRLRYDRRYKDKIVLWIGKQFEDKMTVMCFKTTVEGSIFTPIYSLSIIKDVVIRTLIMR